MDKFIVKIVDDHNKKVRKKILPADKAFDYVQKKMECLPDWYKITIEVD